MSSYRITITLKDRIYSKIHRIVLADGKVTFFQLHHAICQMMGLKGYHLRDFEYRIRDHIVLKIICPQEDQEKQDIRGWAMDKSIKPDCDIYPSVSTTLEQIVIKYPKLLYCYDYGDNWQFEISTQHVSQSVPEKKIICIDTIGGHIIEDCGGVVGMADWIQLYEAEKWDKESFESKKDFIEKIMPYLTPYQINDLSTIDEYQQSIEQLIKNDQRNK